jgi:hypothetical protein
LGTVLNCWYNFSTSYYRWCSDVIPTGGRTWQDWGSMTGVEGWQYPVPPLVYAASSSHNGGSGPYRYMHPMSGQLGSYWYFGAQYGVATMGEDYIGPGSSGKYPYSYNTYAGDPDGMYLDPLGVQVCGAMYTSTYSPMAGGGGTPIVGLYTGNARMGSWGNNRSGYRQYFVGYPWAAVKLVPNGARNTSGQVVSMARWELLQNILAGLKSDVFTDTGASVPIFAEYTGPAEILQVQPVFWATDGTVTGGAISTSMNYPDPTSTNIYRNTADLFSYSGNAQKPGDAGYDSKYLVRSAATDVPGR